MRLLLIADTHIPKRARDLPEPVWHEVERSDVVIHAGDWVDESLLDELSARAHRLVACWGNNDGPELRSRLPECADVTLDGLRFTVVHETGAASGREARMAQRYPGTDVLVFGHSHIPWDTTARTGLAAAEPRLADRPAPPAVLHVHDRRDPARSARRRAAASDREDLALKQS